MRHTFYFIQRRVLDLRILLIFVLTLSQISLADINIIRKAASEITSPSNIHVIDSSFVENLCKTATGGKPDFYRECVKKGSSEKREDANLYGVAMQKCSTFSISDDQVYNEDFRAWKLDYKKMYDCFLNSVNSDVAGIQDKALLAQVKECRDKELRRHERVQKEGKLSDKIKEDYAFSGGWCARVKFTDAEGALRYSKQNTKAASANLETSSAMGQP